MSKKKQGWLTNIFYQFSTYQEEEDEIISFCVPIFMPNDRTLTIQPMVLLHYTAVAAADYANAMPKLS